jgi:hypothetical protein
MENSEMHMASVGSMGRRAGDAVNDTKLPAVLEESAPPLTIPRAEVTALITTLEQLHGRLPSRSLRGVIMRMRRWLAPSV